MRGRIPTSHTFGATVIPVEVTAGDTVRRIYLTGNDMILLVKEVKYHL